MQSRRFDDDSSCTTWRRICWQTKHLQKITQQQPVSVSQHYGRQQYSPLHMHILRNSLTVCMYRLFDYSFHDLFINSSFPQSFENWNYHYKLTRVWYQCPEQSEYGSIMSSLIIHCVSFSSQRYVTWLYDAFPIFVSSGASKSRMDNLPTDTNINLLSILSNCKFC